MSIIPLPPFPFHTLTAEFDRAFLRKLQLEQKRIRNSVIPERNSQSFSHGRNWQTAPNVDGDKSGAMETHSFEFATRFEDIVSHNLKIITNFRRGIADSMHQQFMESLYGTIGRSTEKSGNIVNASDHVSMAEAFLAILRKIEFGIDEDGRVSLPEFHLGPEVYEKMLASVAEKGSEFEKEVEQVKAEKSAAALERERERLAKYPHSGEED